MGREGERKGEQRKRVFWEPLSLNENYQLPNVRTKIQIGRNERNMVEKKPTTSPIPPPFNSFLPPPPPNRFLTFAFPSTSAIPPQSVCLSVYFFSLFLFVCPFVCRSLSAILCFGLSICLCLSLYLSPSVYLSVDHKICLSVCLSLLPLSLSGQGK